MIVAEHPAEALAPTRPGRLVAETVKRLQATWRDCFEWHRAPPSGGVLNFLADDTTASIVRAAVNIVHQPTVTHSCKFPRGITPTSNPRGGSSNFLALVRWSILAPFLWS